MDLQSKGHNAFHVHQTRGSAAVRVRLVEVPRPDVQVAHRRNGQHEPERLLMYGCPIVHQGRLCGVLVPLKHESGLEPLGGSTNVLYTADDTSSEKSRPELQLTLRDKAEDAPRNESFELLFHDLIASR